MFFIESRESDNSKLIFRTKSIKKVYAPLFEVVQETLEPFIKSNNMRYYLKVSPKGIKVKSVFYF